MSYSEWVKGRETGYIDRAKLLNEMEHECENCEFRDSDGYECEECDYAHAMLYVKAQKAIKIQHVKRGHWYDVGAEYIKEIGQFKIHAFCSECHRLNYHLSDYSQNMEAEFCQHCGAEMNR